MTLGFLFSVLSKNFHFQNIIHFCQKKQQFFQKLSVFESKIHRFSRRIFIYFTRTLTKKMFIKFLHTKTMVEFAGGHWDYYFKVYQKFSIFRILSFTEFLPFLPKFIHFHAKLFVYFTQTFPIFTKKCLSFFPFLSKIFTFFATTYLIQFFVKV